MGYNPRDDILINKCLFEIFVFVPDGINSVVDYYLPRVGVVVVVFYRGVSNISFRKV